MPIKHHNDEHARTTNGLAPEESMMHKATNITNKLNPELQGYLAIAVGTFFLLFGLGFFNFVFSFIKIGIGVLGIALVAWGALRSHLLSNVIHWFKKLTKRS